MAGVTEDLKATADSIRHDAERLALMEKEKSGLDPSDPRVDAISRDIEKLIAVLADKAKAERELADAEKPKAPGDDQASRRRPN